MNKSSKNTFVMQSEGPSKTEYINNIVTRKFA